jgi:hypothetical protein
VLEALCNRVIPQDHRPADERVPIAPFIDQRCFHRAIDGFRFEDMPPQEVTWKNGLAGLDETSRQMFRRGFTELGHK